VVETVQRILLFGTVAINTGVPYLAQYKVSLNFKKQVGENTATTTRSYNEEIGEGNQATLAEQSNVEATEPSEQADKNETTEANPGTEDEHSAVEATPPLEQADQEIEGNEVKTAATLTKNEIDKIGIPNMNMSGAQFIIIMFHAKVVFVFSLIVKHLW
jgi:hypothetical protein